MNQPRLDKSKIKRSFSAAANRYDGLAGLQRRVGLDLLDLFPLHDGANRVLDMGCGTGFLTGQLAASTAVQRLIALDIALPMLATSRQCLPVATVDYVCADAEQLPFADACLEAIFSNLALQWIANLPGLFADCRRVLKPGGELVFAIFGPDTLWELKQAWAGVDAYTHVNEFYSGDEIGRFLREAGFETAAVKGRLYRLDYPSVMDLMKELKGIGAHNVNLGRKRRPTTRSQLASMIGCYPGRAETGSIVASYEIIFVRATVA